ncbi:hypothetical protein FDE15_25805 [Vibrio parahaemolyticus]|nr:hypothetical protein [Vibrio parahaemolyticus]
MTGYWSESPARRHLAMAKGSKGGGAGIHEIGPTEWLTSNAATQFIRGNVEHLEVLTLHFRHLTQPARRRRSSDRRGSASVLHASARASGTSSML